MSTHRAENLTAAGPSGTGKSHFVEALAHEAIEEGMQVAWFTLESLTAHLGRATVDNSVSKAAAEAFYRVIDAAYERRSVIVTSNLCPSKAHMFRRTRARYCQHVTGSMVPRRLPSHPGVRAKRL
ncbi:ATP-binding protein [Streptomyces sviceus]|uniref:ATP-binding protein n=1 Tax=Streptomyces sviceus TaxID=285530 RepID=UPI0033191E47